MFRFFARLWQGETDGLTAAAFIVGTASLASRLVGIFRDRMLASTFGAGNLLDSYYAAFRLPDTLYNLIILGALSAGFIPVFSAWLETKSREDAMHLAEKVLSIVGATMAVACAFLFFFAPVLVPIIAPGFEGEKLQTTIALTRIMVLSPLFLGMSAVMGGVLQSTRRFFAFAVAPVLYNLSIISGIYFLSPSIGIYGAAFGVVLGAFLHFIAQTSVAFRLGIRRLPRPSLSDPGVRKILRLMAPRALGLAITQINLAVLLAIATTIETGAVAVLNLATNLQSFPVGIFGISFAIAAFPELARSAGKGDMEGYRQALGGASRKIVFLILPTMALFILLRAQIVRTILGQGLFDWNDTIRTADMLGWFSLSLFAQALTPLFTRAFYAIQNVRTPIIIIAVAEVANIILVLLLKGPFGVAGLAVAFSITAIAQLLLLVFFLRKQQGALGRGEFALSAYKTSIATVALCVAAYPVRQAIGTIYSLRTFLQVVLQAGATIVVGGLVFILIAWLLRSRELFEFWDAIHRKLWRHVKLEEGVDQAGGLTGST